MRPLLFFCIFACSRLCCDHLIIDAFTFSGVGCSLSRQQLKRESTNKNKTLDADSLCDPAKIFFLLWMLTCNLCSGALSQLARFLRESLPYLSVSLKRKDTLMLKVNLNLKVDFQIAMSRSGAGSGSTIRVWVQKTRVDSISIGENIGFQKVWFFPSRREWGVFTAVGNRPNLITPSESGFGVSR